MPCSVLKPRSSSWRPLEQTYMTNRARSLTRGVIGALPLALLGCQLDDDPVVATSDAADEPAPSSDARPDRFCDLPGSIRHTPEGVITVPGGSFQPSLRVPRVARRLLRALLRQRRKRAPTPL